MLHRLVRVTPLLLELLRVGEEERLAETAVLARRVCRAHPRRHPRTEYSRMVPQGTGTTSTGGSPPHPASRGSAWPPRELATARGEARRALGSGVRGRGPRPTYVQDGGDREWVTDRSPRWR